jgi:predicted AAA+ superfamily ATPase
MPHSRPRYVQTLIEKAMTHSPIVGVLGHRQVGKTTLTSKMAKEYVTFDVLPRLEEATARPMEFLENRKDPFAIDEAQLCPPLFPAAKEWVRVHPKKGQFIFTGSVRFTSRKIIRESLTGRIVNVEILPMTLSELHEMPLPNRLSEISQIENSAKLDAWIQKSEKNSPKNSPKNCHETVLQYLQTGGLPGICFFRDAGIRQARFEAHLDTILNRDVQLVVATTLSSLQLRKLAAYLAENQGSPFSLRQAATACQSSTATVKKIVQAFEALFLVRPIAAEGTVSKVSFFFEDQGLATHLSKNSPSETDQILRAIYANLRQELYYRPHPKNEIFSYRTHDGTDVPLVFRCESGVIGVIPSDEKQITLKALGSARSFLAQYPEGKIIVAYRGQEAETRDFRTIAMPYWWLC